MLVGAVGRVARRAASGREPVRAGVLTSRGRVRAAVLAPLVGLALVGLPAAAGPSVAQSGGVQAYFFGDSLMNGTGASPRRPVMARVAAARLGWEVQVDAWGGTGYTTTGSGPRLPRPAAAARARWPGPTTWCCSRAAPTTPATPVTRTPSRAAVHAVVDEVQRRQPQALVVLMGAYDPPPPGLVDPRRAVVDALVADVAAERGLPFFSPLSGGWTAGVTPAFLHRRPAAPLDPRLRGDGRPAGRGARRGGGAVRAQLPDAPDGQQRAVDRRRAEDLGRPALAEQEERPGQQDGGGDRQAVDRDAQRAAAASPRPRRPRPSSARPGRTARRRAGRRP